MYFSFPPIERTFCGSSKYIKYASFCRSLTAFSVLPGDYERRHGGRAPFWDSGSRGFDGNTALSTASAAGGVEVCVRVFRATVCL